MKIGFAFCGSFCNHPGLLKIYEDIAREHEIVPILSENAAKYSTRFGTAEDFVTRVEAIAGRRAVRNIVEAEPLGPQGAMEALVIAPCTGNTLAKLANGITAIKSVLPEGDTSFMKDKLEKLSGKTVTLTQKTDPTVLAGLRVELEGKQLDGTVKSRLDGLSRKLNELIV